MIKTLIIIAIVFGTFFLALMGYMAGFIRATRLFSYKNAERTKFEKNLINKLVKDDPNIDANFKSIYLKHEEGVIDNKYKERMQFLKDIQDGKLDDLNKYVLGEKQTPKAKPKAKAKKKPKAKKKK